MNEIEKMKLGLLYDANNDHQLLHMRLLAQDLCFQLNQTRPMEENQRHEIIKQLLQDDPKGLVLLSPFVCDYGNNIHLGEDVFINMNCYFMDCASIKLGNHVFVGPYCGFYTGTHPLDYKTRNKGLEQALPIVVGDNCWFGANVSVMPGVSIGEGCVIGAGSVVTKDIPPHSLALGVPARVIKSIDQGE